MESATQTVLAVGAGVLAALIDTKALNWLLFSPLMGKAQLNEMEAEKRNREVLAASEQRRGMFADFEGITPEMRSPVLLRGANSFLAELELSQHNRESIAALALAELQQSGEPLPEENPLDEDWMVRFYRYSADITTEQAQKVWGKLLAGEVRKPGSYSPRTLSILRNLTKQDVENIKKIAPFVVGSAIPANYLMNKEPGMAAEIYSAIVSLSRLGLVDSPGGDLKSIFLDYASVTGIVYGFLKIINTQHIQLEWKTIPIFPEFAELSRLDDTIFTDKAMLSHYIAELRSYGFEVEVFSNKYIDDKRIFDPEKEGRIFRLVEQTEHAKE